MMLYLEGEEIPETKIRAALRRATIANKVIPVLCGSSYKNKGVQELLDAIVDFLPSPLDKPAITGVNPRTEEEETVQLMTARRSPLWRSRLRRIPTSASWRSSGSIPVRWRPAKRCSTPTKMFGNVWAASC